MVIEWPSTSNCVVWTYGSTTLFPSSSIATPSMVKPLSAYFCWKPIIQGISTRQGSHHVAQKFTITTFPFRLASVTSCPSKFLKVTAGSSGRASVADGDLPLAAAPETLNHSWELHPEKFVVTINTSNNSAKKRFGGLRIRLAPITIKTCLRIQVYLKAMSAGS